MKKKGPIVQGGGFYGRVTPDGPLVPAPDEDATPDVWICRRVSDFPGGRVPEGGRVSRCSHCFALIVFNPARQVTAPKVCMQCAQIEPLPIEPPS